MFFLVFLFQIWGISNQSKSGALVPNEFIVALRLIALAQNGREPTAANALAGGLFSFNCPFSSLPSQPIIYVFQVCPCLSFKVSPEEENQPKVRPNPPEKHS